MTNKISSINTAPAPAPTLRQFLKSVSIEEREQHCPVRAKFMKGKETTVTEYLIPVSIIRLDQKSQARRKGKSGNTVSQLRRQMEHDGQRHGVCVEYVNGTFYVRWGNHRYNACRLMLGQNLPILDTELGYIWVSVYNLLYQKSDLNELQAMENNIVEAKEPADDETNVHHLRVQFEHNPEFLNSSETEQRKMLRDFIRRVMGANVPKPKTLIDKFYQSVEGIRTDTKTKKECEEHFNVHANASGFGNVRFDGAGSRNNIQSINGVQTAMYCADGTITDANIGQMYNRKFLSKTAGSIILLASFQLKDLATPAKLAEARRDLLSSVREHNKMFRRMGCALIDHLLIMPQTEEEENASRNGTPWVAQYGPTSL